MQHLPIPKEDFPNEKHIFACVLEEHNADGRQRASDSRE
jgi:hypothetical protein